MSPTRGSPRRVTVTMAVRNERATLPAQLDALAGQTFQGEWEVILADNGSKDGTAEIARDWFDRLPIRVVDAPERSGRSYALNAAVSEASGDFVLTCDGDDVVDAGWVEAMVRAAPGLDLAGGSLEFSLLNHPRVLEWRPPPDQNDLQLGLQWLPCARGANFGIWLDVLENLGGFDERYSLGQDWALCFRAQVAGYRLGFVPDAIVHYRNRTSLAALTRQRFRYGTTQADLFRQFRAAGAPRPSLAGGAKSWAMLAVQAPAAAFSPSKRGRWLGNLAYRSGRIAGSLRYGVLFP